MSVLLDVDEKIKNVKKEKEMTEADFEALLDTLKTMIKEGDKIEENIVTIFKSYTKAIRDLGDQLNYLYLYKGEATNK